MSTTTTPVKEESFFNLHTIGIGYLRRIREVKPKKGKSFLACDIAALNGPIDDVSYVRFDCRVVGEEAQRLVRLYKQDVDEEKKVLIGFKLGDLWTEIFTYKSGDRKGEQGVSLKARLLRIDRITIDGKRVYPTERPEAKSADESSGRTPVEAAKVAKAA
jgi:hypothetical protein